MENLEAIFERYGIHPHFFTLDKTTFIDFDHGIHLTMECLDEIRARFPDKTIEITGFFGDTGFRIKLC